MKNTLTNYLKVVLLLSLFSLYGCEEDQMIVEDAFAQQTEFSVIPIDSYRGFPENPLIGGFVQDLVKFSPHNEDVFLRNISWREARFIKDGIDYLMSAPVLIDSIYQGVVIWSSAYVGDMYFYPKEVVFGRARKDNYCNSHIVLAVQDYWSVELSRNGDVPTVINEFLKKAATECSTLRKSGGTVVGGRYVQYNASGIPSAVIGYDVNVVAPCGVGRSDVNSGESTSYHLINNG